MNELSYKESITSPESEAEILNGSVGSVTKSGQLGTITILASLNGALIQECS